MNLQDRADNYNNTFSKWPPVHVEGRWLYGVWMIGNNYRSRQGYHGEYPATYLNRIHALFPDAKRVLHLFSGMVDIGRWPEEITLDQSSDTQPDVLCNVEKRDWMEKVLLAGDKGEFDLVLADPPYSEEDAQKYGVSLIHRNVVLKDTRSVVKPSGHLVWLDQVYPMWTKRDWQAMGTIGIWRSTNHRFRGCTIFERNCDELAGV